MLTVIVSKIDFDGFSSTLKKINLDYVLSGIFLVLPLAAIKAWRWNYLKKIQGIKFNFLDSFLIYNIGFAVGAVTPGKIGEIVKIYYLKNRNCSTGKSLVSVVTDRLMDLIYLFIFGYISVFFLFKEIKLKINLLYLLSFLSLITLVFIIKKGWHKKILKKIFFSLIPQKYQTIWHTNFSDFFSDLKKIPPKKYAAAFIITLLSWLIYYLQVEIFAWGIGLKIPFILLAAAITVSGLATLLPISFLGIGARETILIIILGSYVKNISDLIILSQLILLANVAAIIIGLISWKLRPIPIKI